MQGTVVLEDATISWHQTAEFGGPDAPMLFNVAISEAGPDGAKNWVGQIPAKDFMTALATAISWDGEVPSSEYENARWWRAIEQVANLPDMPRWMP